MENPYVFDTVNSRLVAKVDRETVNANVSKTYYYTGLIYAASVVGFQRRYVRSNIATGGQAGIFMLLSLPCAYSYASFFTNSANNEAAVINN